MLFSMFLRSFFIQAGWNYERFQNLGFVFALAPALRRIYPDREKLKAALLRHLEIFNTQPYMSGFVLGNIAAMEERASSAADPAAELAKMPGVKQALASSFASIGDRIFWGRLKPMTAQICLLVWAAGGFYGWLFTGLDERVPLALLLGGPLAGTVFYSAFAVYYRWKGVRRGFACGGAANCALDTVNWPRLIRLLSIAGFLMSLAIVALAFSLLIGVNGCACGGWRLALKAVVPVCVLALHRLTRAFGRSVFFAAGALLAVSILLFSVFGLEPLKFYL